MLRAGIIGDRHIGPAIVPEVFNVIPAAYFNLPNEVLDPWLDYITLSLLTTLEFRNDNTLFLFARLQKHFYALKEYKVKG